MPPKDVERMANSVYSDQTAQTYMSQYLKFLRYKSVTGVVPMVSQYNLNPFIPSGMDGWRTWDFNSFLTVLQSYQDDVWMIMKGCMQWNSVYD